MEASKAPIKEDLIGDVFDVEEALKGADRVIVLERSVRFNGTLPEYQEWRRKHA